MAGMVRGKALDFAQVMHSVREVLEQLPDARRGKNLHYRMVDAGLSAFSVFFMQCSSFLEYQRRMQQEQGRNNVQSIFGAHDIPSDNQIRNLLDAVPPQTLQPLYEQLLQGLMAQGVIDGYRTLQGKVLLALDGVTYFSSSKLHCAQCSQRHHAGRTLYSHTALTPVLVQPGQSKVVALAPEFVTPQDGSAKQDCELNAAQRWLQRHGARWAEFGAVVLGDDLYCHEPFCRALRAQGLDFVLVCKPDSHATTYEWLQMLERSGDVRSMTIRRSNGRRIYLDHYRWASALPLRDADAALTVDWCELSSTDEEGKVLYRNSFASSLPIDETNVHQIVAAGRARWDEFPQIISDDTFARLQFQEPERFLVDAPYEWPLVEGFSPLVRVRRRQDQGVAEIARLFPDLPARQGHVRPDRGELLRLAAADPVGFAVYAAVALAVRTGRNKQEWARGR